MIPQGRFTLKQAIKFIADHQANPDTWTAAAIAKEYNVMQDKIGIMYTKIGIMCTAYM
jgi:hypothetical protein